MIKQLIATTLLSISPLISQPKTNKNDSTNEPILTTPYRENESWQYEIDESITKEQYISDYLQIGSNITNIHSNKTHTQYVNNEINISIYVTNQAYKENNTYKGQTLIIVNLIPYITQEVNYDIQSSNLWKINATNFVYNKYIDENNIETWHQRADNLQINYNQQKVTIDAINSISNLLNPIETLEFTRNYQTSLEVQEQNVMLKRNTQYTYIITYEYTNNSQPEAFETTTRQLNTICDGYFFYGEFAIQPTTEVIDLPGLMFQILGMPFAFISQAFNVTLFPNTPYQVNISNIFLTLIAILLFLWLIKLILGKADIGSFIADQKDSYTKQNNKNKKANKDKE